MPSPCGRSVYSECARFPNPVPSDTSIPSWAYLNLEGGDTWDYFSSAKSELLFFYALNVKIDTPTHLDATNGVWTPPQSLSAPAIVGISLGATGLAALIIFLLFFWCRHRRHRKGASSIQYNRIEGPSRKPGGLFSATKRVTSYRPGLNFDLVKNRTGDLVELSQNQPGTQSTWSVSSLASKARGDLVESRPSSQNQTRHTRTQSAWGSVSSLVSKVRSPSTRHENDPQKQLGHHATSSLSNIFTRPKEVRSQVVPPDFDISEGL